MIQATIRIHSRAATWHSFVRGSLPVTGEGARSLPARGAFLRERIRKEGRCAARRHQDGQHAARMDGEYDHAQVRFRQSGRSVCGTFSGLPRKGGWGGSSPPGHGPYKPERPRKGAGFLRGRAFNLPLAWWSSTGGSPPRTTTSPPRIGRGSEGMLVDAGRARQTEEAGTRPLVSTLAVDHTPTEAGPGGAASGRDMAPGGSPAGDLTAGHPPLPHAG